MSHVIGLLFTRNSDIKLLESYLQHEGYDVLTSNPNQMDLQEWRKASLIIADRGAAKYYGEELPRLRWSNSSFLPLLIALRPNETAETWLKKGFNDVLRTPIQKAEMKARIELYLRLREQSEQQYRAFFENALIGIYRMERSGTMLMANPALADMLGYKSTPALLRTSEKLPIGPGAHRPDFNMQLREFDKVVGFESNWERKNGSTIWVRENAMAVYDHQNRMMYCEGTVEDISEQKRAVKALREAKEAAEQANRAKSTFLANMSHEIRTPLTSIVGFTSFLSRRLSGKELKYVEMIERSGKRLMDTLNALLTLAKLEADSVDIEYEPVTIAAEVDRVSRLMQNQAVDKQLDLQHLVEDEARNATALLDAGALNSILQNLVSNAIKFTDEGHVHLRTYLSEERNEVTEGLTAFPALCIEIKDTGRGIKENFLSEVFEAFEQESSGLTRTHQGIGLGLSITEQLVDLMNGVVHVESQEDEGSTFTVCFPTADAPDKELGRSRNNLKTDEGGTRILVVEDNNETRFLLESVLDKHASADIAATVDEALATARSGTYDLLLIDIDLGSEKSGLDLLRELRTYSGFSEMPAIALTAYALPGDREQFLRAGFDDYLSKPFDVGELLDIIDRNL